MLLVSLKKKMEDEGEKGVAVSMVQALDLANTEAQRLWNREIESRFIQAGASAQTEFS